MTSQLNKLITVPNPGTDEIYSKGYHIKKINDILISASDHEVKIMHKLIKCVVDANTDDDPARNNNIDNNNVNCVDGNISSGNSDQNDTEETKQRILIILKVMNNLLNVLGYKEINDISDFKVKREDMISQKAIDCIENDYDWVFKKNKKLFDRKNCGWYYRKTLKTYHLTFLKGLLDHTNKFEIISKRFRSDNDEYIMYIVVKK